MVPKKQCPVKVRDRTTGKRRLCQGKFEDDNDTYCGIHAKMLLSGTLQATTAQSPTDHNLPPTPPDPPPAEAQTAKAQTAKAQTAKAPSKGPNSKAPTSKDGDTRCKNC